MGNWSPRVFTCIHYNVLAEVYAFANSVIYAITMCLSMLNFAINNVLESSGFSTYEINAYLFVYK